MLSALRTNPDSPGAARTRRRLVLLAGCVPVLVACSSADTATRQAAALLEQTAERAHQRALAERAEDPASRDQAAADRLGETIAGDPTAVVAATPTADGVEVVTTVGARAQAGGGLSYETATLGACLRTTATPGTAAGDPGERGTVTTEAVSCPDRTVPIADSAPVDAITTDLPRLRSDVPRPEPRGCLSGSGDCAGG